MPSSSIRAARMNKGTVSLDGMDPLLGLAVGCAGGALGSALLTVSLVSGTLVGALFGLGFGLFFAHRATSSGAGLIWGLGAALLLWLALPVGILPLFSGAIRSMAQLTDAQDHFPELVAYLTSLGMPVCAQSGIPAALRYKLGKTP